MLWENIEYLYDGELNKLKRFKNNNIYNEKEFKVAYQMLKSIIRHLKCYECEDFPRINNNVFTYRGESFDVKFDDYGQCLYIDLPNGKSPSGGTYNSEPELEFSEFIDEYLDEKFFND